MMPLERDPTEGLTLRDLVMEVRTNIARLHDDLGSFKSTVVLRSEYEKDREYSRQVRKWGITTIVALMAVGTTATGIVLANIR